MQDKVQIRFTRVWEGLLLIAVIIGFANIFAHPKPDVSLWLSYSTISLSIAAIFVYGIVFGMKLRG